MNLTIERAEQPTEEIRVLIQQLEAELSPHYEAHQRHGLKLEAIFQPGIPCRREISPPASSWRNS